MAMVLTLGAVWAALVAPAQACSDPACTTPVNLPFELPFSSDQGGIAGTGFTLVDGPLRSDLLTLDTSAGVLRIRTTSGIAYRTANSQDNALGVAMPADGQAVILETTLVQPPEGTQNYEQAGIWYGTSQDDYVKLVLISSRTGLRVQMLHEGSGLRPKAYSGPVLPSAPATITLRLRVDAVGGSLTGAYEIPGAPAKAVAKWWPLPAGLVTSGMSRGGIFATHRYASGELEYSFDRFEVRCISEPCPGGPAPPDPGVGDGTDPVGVSDEDEVEVDKPPTSGQSPTIIPAAGTGGTNPVGSLVTPGARPRVSASARRRIRLRALRRRGLAARVRCTEKCDARLDLLARKKGESRLTRIANQARITGGLDRRVTIVLTSGAARRLSGVRKLELRIQARFADGSTASLTRGVKLRR
jgi:hypothetical protein